MKLGTYLPPGKPLYYKQKYSLMFQILNFIQNYGNCSLKSCCQFDDMNEGENLWMESCCPLLSCWGLLCSTQWSLFKMHFIFPLHGLCVIGTLINGSWVFNRSRSLFDPFLGGGLIPIDLLDSSLRNTDLPAEVERKGGNCRAYQAID